MGKEPTEQEMKDYCDKLLNKFRQDPQYELQQELGRFLIRHIDDLTLTERKRYDELIILLTEKPV
jgi:hypothetical protein